MEELKNIRGKKPSSKEFELRKKMNDEEICANCHKLFKKRELEIEHPIPVCIGGDIDIFSFFCRKCHVNKTKKDLLFIHFLKKSNLLIKIGQFNYLISNKEKIIEIYKEINSLLDNLDKLDSYSL